MRKVLERLEKRGMSSAEILEFVREMYKFWTRGIIFGEICLKLEDKV
jgi:hypothetical protein